MSRLYSTLEKIRAHESVTSQPRPPISAGSGVRSAWPRGRQWAAVLTLFAVAGGAAGFYASGQPRSGWQGLLAFLDTRMIFSSRSAPEAMPTPLPKAGHAAKPDDRAVIMDESYQRLNDRGVAHFHKNEHWQGLYYFEIARKKEPARPEAIINMAVTLAELGLQAPAARLFAEAYALAPDHSLLHKNMKLLEQTGFLDAEWLAMLNTGKPGDGL